MKFRRKQRIKPITPEECTDEQTELMKSWRLPDGTVPNLILAYIHHPDLLKRWFPYGMHVMRDSTLPPRHRELIIMRVAWHNQSDYEWGHHARLSRAVGITDAELKLVTVGHEAEGLTDFERLLLRAVDEMKFETTIKDETYEGLSAEYDVKQMLDVIQTFGAYNMVSMSLNIFGIQLEDGIAGLEAVS